MGNTRYTHNKRRNSSRNHSSGYIDYSKRSRYIQDENEIVRELSQIEKQKRYVIWVQEFSKKIVTILFILFVIFSFAELALIYMSFKNGYTTGLDTLISETHLTFREVIGGYLIKAGVENAFKIGGNYFVGVSDAKLQMFKEELANKGYVKNPVQQSTTEQTQEDTPEYEQDIELDYDFETLNMVNPNRYE